MDEAKVKALIDAALADLKLPSFDTIKADAKAWLKGGLASVAKWSLKGGALLAAIAGAVVAGHFL